MLTTVGLLSQPEIHDVSNMYILLSQKNWFLQLCRWLITKFVPSHSRTNETLHFLLDHPRRCFIYLFPSHQTWFLLTIVVSLTCVQLIYIQVCTNVLRTLCLGSLTGSSFWCWILATQLSTAFLWELGSLMVYFKQQLWEQRALALSRYLHWRLLLSAPFSTNQSSSMLNFLEECFMLWWCTSVSVSGGWIC